MAEAPTDASTFVDVLRTRAQRAPDARAFTFVTDGETADIAASYGELDRQARVIAAHLRHCTTPGDRVLLLYPPGLDYIAGFFGCLYAGVVAVPAYPPDPLQLVRILPRIQAISTDARAVCALTTARIVGMSEFIFARAPELRMLQWIATDELDASAADTWTAPALEPGSLAFLQYTSGSTGVPKGVMVGHANLVDNARLTSRALGLDQGGVAVSWLPPYHDMGLIGFLLQPIFDAVPTVLMSPLSFLKHPARWLQTLSRFHGTISGGPNFAFDLCARRVTDDECESLDLSSWDIALCGAEPVRPRTLERFHERFAPCGLRREALHTAYGLAEATLTVAITRRGRAADARGFDRVALGRNRAVESRETGAGATQLVTCGVPVADDGLRVVDPESLEACEPGHVGEIWCSAPNVALGYFNRPDESEQVFRARLRRDDGRTYLRTGDLGFLRAGQLFVTSRLKDLVIIFGRNHSPIDLEQTVEDCDPALRTGVGAAFCIEGEEVERLVLVHEYDPRREDGPPVAELVDSIRRAINEQHQIQVHAVVLVKRGSVPRTSSGKVQRRACRDAYLAGGLDVLHGWTRGEREVRSIMPPPFSSRPPGGAVGASGPGTGDALAIQEWLVARMAARLGLKPTAIDLREPFSTYGLTSVDAVGLAGQLERWLLRRVPPTAFWEHPNISALARHLAGEPAVAKVRARTPLRVERSALQASEPIAIVGIGCRFPGADGPDAFWALLRDGVDAITEVPPSRWDAKAWYDPDPTKPGRMVTRWGGFLRDVDRFDARFFGISPREAGRVDPQQRLLLEVAWEALEDAGIPALQLAGSSTGVFVGISNSDYAVMQFGDASLVDPYANAGAALSIAANRISYQLDLRGPSVAVDTACSSSLVALNMACESLHAGHSTLAIAAGVNLILTPQITANFSRAGFMAPDGRCKAFDSRADGYVRSEGVGVVVLKPLSAALADRDRVYAIVRGGAVNQDGRSNGLNAPNPQAQEAVLREAYRRAGVSPGRVAYVEAHGTGTALGDPIEAGALGAVMATDRPAGSACAIGSVKTNVGHLEAAAGIAGVIKVALAIAHRAIPPSLHFVEPNPHIRFDELPLRVQQTLGPWPDGDAPPLAGVSSFGFGGTNAHIVLQGVPLPGRDEPVLQAGSASMPTAHVLPMSARSPEALRALGERYDALAHEDGLAGTLADVTYAASVRRSHMDHRAAVVARSWSELRVQLDALARGEDRRGVATGHRRIDRAPSVVYVFGGQGAQWWGMGRELLDLEPVFRRAVAEFDAHVTRIAGWSVVAELNADEARSRLDETEVTQPVTVAIQLGLAALFAHWGVPPAAVVGHSAGEIAAAHVAGVLSVEEAARVAVQRGRVVQRAPVAAMAAIELGADELERMLAGYGGRISIAAINGSSSTVVSGEADALDALLAGLAAEGVAAHVIRVRYASHSPQMAPYERELSDALRNLAPAPATVTLVSTVTGATGEVYDAAYWGRQLRSPVRFADALATLVAAKHDVFLELDPHPIVATPLATFAAERSGEIVVVPTLRRLQDERASLYEALATLYAHGAPVAWHRVHPARRRSVRLPLYPWQRQAYWLPAGVGVDVRADGHDPRRLGEHIESSLSPDTHFWTRSLSIERIPALADHAVLGTPVLPAAAYVTSALAAADALGMHPVVLRDLAITAPLPITPGAPRTLQIALEPPDAAGVRALRVSSRDETGPPARWRVHATAHLAPDATTGRARIVLADVRARCIDTLDGSELYTALRARGLEYGPRFQGVEHVVRRTGEALGRLRASGSSTSQPSPELLDAAFHVAAAALDGLRGDGAVYLPVAIARCTMHGRAADIAWAHATRTHGDERDETLQFDIALTDDEGVVQASVEGLRVRRASRHADASVVETLYATRWTRAEAIASTPPTECVVFADEGGTAAALVERLARVGVRCVQVGRDIEYARIGPDAYRVDPSRGDHLRRLLEDVGADRVVASRVFVHLWNLDAPDATSLTPARIDEAVETGCTSVLYLAQALAASPPASATRLIVATRGAQAVGETAPVSIAQAPVWGLARAIVEEHPELGCITVDLDPAGGDDASALATEVSAATGEDRLAWRAGTRHAPRLVRDVDAARLVAMDESDPTPRAHGLRPDAAYLVTGGLGGLGLRVARWMHERGARNIVLLGRRPPTPPVEREVDALRATGARIVVLQADVADARALRTALANLDALGAPLRGVVHAAGVLDDGALAAMTRVRFDAALVAKVHGAWNLHTLLDGLPLDFFVLFSSASALVTAAMQGSYAAANAFLDALAAHRHARGRPAQSIAWGPWREIGLAAMDDARGARLETLGVRGLAPAEGLAALGWLLGHPRVQPAVLRLDLPVIARHANARGGAPPVLRELLDGLIEPAQLVPAGPGAAMAAEDAELRARLERTPAARRRDVLVDYLGAQVCRVLGFDPSNPPEPRQRLFALGLDSMMAMQLRKRLQTAMGRPLPATLLFDRPTIEDLADYLVAGLGSAPVAPPVRATPPRRDARASALASIDELSDEEIERRLAARAAKQDA